MPAKDSGILRLNPMMTNMTIFLFFTLWGPPSPLKVRQNFLLDVNRQPLWGVPVVLCLGAVTGPVEFFDVWGVPKVYSRTDPADEGEVKFLPD